MSFEERFNAWWRNNVVEPVSENSREWEKEHIWIPLGNKAKAIGMDVWHWFVSVIPDIMGYGAMLTGALAILYVLSGRGMIKPFGVYGGLLIVSISVLAVN